MSQPASPADGSSDADADALLDPIGPPLRRPNPPILGPVPATPRDDGAADEGSKYRRARRPAPPPGGSRSVEAPDASCALAAAEVDAALKGRPAQDLPDDLRSWIEGKSAPKDGIVSKAREAVAAVLKGSELRDLWEESDGLEDWQPIVQDLQRRLG